MFLNAITVMFLFKDILDLKLKTLLKIDNFKEQQICMKWSQIIYLEPKKITQAILRISTTHSHFVSTIRLIRENINIEFLIK